jgi:hypothetical protein
MAKSTGISSSWHEKGMARTPAGYGTGFRLRITDRLAGFPVMAAGGGPNPGAIVIFARFAEFSSRAVTMALE